MTTKPEPFSTVPFHNAKGYVKNRSMEQSPIFRSSGPANPNLFSVDGNYLHSRKGKSPLLICIFYFFFFFKVFRVFDISTTNLTGKVRRKTKRFG
jgi:hypothetical protein